jgi:hypothetical protein
VGKAEEPKVEEKGKELVELQNARTTAIGVGNYNVPIDIIKYLSMRLINTF